MIWLIRDEDGEISFYTSDNKKFKNIKSATNYASLNYDKLVKNNETFNLMIERNKKLNLIINKINQLHN